MIRSGDRRDDLEYTDLVSFCAHFLLLVQIETNLEDESTLAHSVCMWVDFDDGSQAMRERKITK